MTEKKSGKGHHKAEAAAGYAGKEKAAPKPKFKVGDQVTYKGRLGEVTEVSPHDEHWYQAGHPQVYSVRVPTGARETYLDSEGNEQVRWRNPKTGETFAHEFDVLGGVVEGDLTAVG